MKNFITLCAAFLLLIVTMSCSSQAGLPQEEVTKLLAQKKFTFVAERANPLDGTVNNIISSMPGAVGTRILNLDSGYEMVVNEDNIVVNLPYFGRSYNPQYGSRNTGFDFTSKDFVYSSEEGRKNTKELTFNIKDQSNFKEFYLVVQPNGKATLSINSNDRQPISYFGYIKANEKEN